MFTFDRSPIRHLRSWGLAGFAFDSDEGWLASDLASSRLALSHDRYMNLMEAFWHDDVADVRTDSTAKRRESLLSVAGLCAVLWTFILLASDVWGPSFVAAPPEQGVPLVAHVHVATVDTDAGAAKINVTIRGAVAGAAAAQGATLRVTLGGGGAAAGAGVAASLPWPAAASVDRRGPDGRLQPAAAAWFEASLPLVQVAGYRVRPFDAYTLALAPISASLVDCSAACAAVAGGAAAENAAVGAGARGERRCGDGCTRVALPVHAVFTGGDAPGFRFTPLPAYLAAAGGGGGGGYCGGGANSLGGLLVSRATSQRTLRLMTQMLQLAIGGYVVAWAAGALVWQWLMGRALSRIHHML